MEPKFLLPSPNFNKNSKEPSKSNLHYLTPCGMTLLPRAKQPPPMYGARGSTVPAKYLKQDQQQEDTINDISDRPPIYNSPPRPEYCSNCGMQLATAQDMRRHLEQHEPCPAEDCDFTALAGILERHIEANHITGLYQTVKKVWTPEDIAAWRAERRKKFPTTANVELAKRAREQRLKRGERLEANKARFGKPEDRRRTRTQNNSKDRPKQKKGTRNSVKKSASKGSQQTLTKPLVDECPPLVKPKSPASARKFCGTSQLSNYQHVKRKTKTVENALSSLLGMYGSETDEETDNDQTENDEKPVTSKDETCETTTENVLEKMKEVHSDNVNITHTPSTESKPGIQYIKEESEADAVANSSDEAPDEVPIERKTEPPAVETHVDQSVEGKSKAADPSTESQKVAAKRPITKKRILGLNFKRARQITKQNTMLSKLLEPDIRHERNVLLQCVRYVCEQNFFGIGSGASSTQNLDKAT